MKKLIAFSLSLILCQVFVVSALAARDPWNCPECGRTANTGNFCENCGQAAPAPAAWDCACGKTENTGNFCPECGRPRPVENHTDPDSPSLPGGSSEKTVLFTVQSDGSAQITLARTKGTCLYMTFTEQTIEYLHYAPSGVLIFQVPSYAAISVPGGTSMSDRWGQYRLRITDPDGHTAERVWSGQESGPDYTLSLPEAGTYEIQVIPFTAEQMKDENSINQFMNWVTCPEWKVVRLHNCQIGG